MAGFTRLFSVPRELPVAALVVAAALPLSRLFRPGGFSGVVLTAVVLSIGISWLTRRFRIPAVVGLLLSVFGLFWFLTGRFHAHTLWGIFPTPASVSVLVRSVREGVSQTINYAVPVPTTPALLTFVAAGVWMSAWLADAAALWVGNPLLAIAATVPLFATPSTLLPSQRRWLDTSLYIAAAAWVLFGEERARAKRWRTSEARLGWRAGPAVRVALIGVLIIVVMTPFLPGYGAPPLLRSKGPGERVQFNPFVAIQATLRKQPEATLLTETTNRPTYLRLTTLEHYDGQVWQQGNARQTVPIGPELIAPYEPGLKFDVVRQSFQIQALAGPWLPAAYDPVKVTDVADVKIETETRSLILPSAGGLPTGVRYQVTSDVPRLTVADLDQPFSYDEQALADYLQLPRVPSVIRELAQRIAGNRPTPYQKALALQDYLRTFTYNENVAADFHHSFKNLVEFLTKSKQGYCEQFAAAMAVMARTLGIPSRVAIGFGFGQRIANQYRITTREAHAWAEIYFPGSGWVAFEPTPRAGVTAVPPYAAPGAVIPSVAPSVLPTASATPSAQPSTGGRDPAHAQAGGSAAQRGRPAWVFGAVIAGIIVALATLAIVLAFTIPRIIRRRARGARGAAAVRYLEFLAWCEGAGLGRRPGETPSEHAARLATETTEAVKPLEQLAGLVDGALWAPEEDVDPDAVESAASDARAALRATLSRRNRLLAAAGWGRWRSAA